MSVNMAHVPAEKYH